MDIFVLNFILECRTIEPSDYRYAPLGLELESSENKVSSSSFLPKSESGLFSIFVIYLGLGSLNSFGSTYFSFLTGFLVWMHEVRLGMVFPNITSNVGYFCVLISATRTMVQWRQFLILWKCCLKLRIVLKWWELEGHHVTGYSIPLIGNFSPVIPLSCLKVWPILPEEHLKYPVHKWHKKYF